MHSHFFESDQLDSVVSPIQEAPPQGYTGSTSSGMFTHGDGANTLHKIRHTYPKMMKLSTVIPYLKKIQNKYNHMTRS